MKKINFEETQQHYFKIIWALFIIIAVILFYACYDQIIIGPPFEENLLPNLLLIIIAVVIGIGTPILYYNTKLKTIVNDEGISLRYIPFHRKYLNFRFNDIRKFEKTTYKPFVEFGGWGIKWGYKKKAYTVWGNEGILIELKDGNRILIGSQKSDEFLSALINAIK